MHFPRIFAGDIAVFQHTPKATYTDVSGTKCTGEENSRTFPQRRTSPPLDDRSATTPYGCCTFYFQVKTNNSKLHPHPAFLARNKPGDKGAIERALPKCHFYLKEAMDTARPFIVPTVASPSCWVMTPAKGDGPSLLPLSSPKTATTCCYLCPPKIQRFSESSSAKAPALPKKK